jgi:hypothetical protein
MSSRAGTYVAIEQLKHRVPGGISIVGPATGKMTARVPKAAEPSPA